MNERISELENMELEKFVEQFAGQFFDTPAEMIKADTEFRQLDEWSSMTGLCILTMIKDEYGFFLDPNIFKQCPTVKDVYEAVKANKK